MCNFEQLKAVFQPSELEWRVQQSGTTKAGKPWAKVLTYVTNRAIMDRLDDVVGPENWKNQFEIVDERFKCILSIRVGDEWVPKEDGADETNIEKTKGGFSSSMKRAAVQWGIGRYLYKLEANWAVFTEKGSESSKIGNKYFSWNPPALPEWALPETVEKVPEKVEVQKPAEKPTSGTQSPPETNQGTGKAPDGPVVLYNLFKNLKSGNGLIKFWKQNEAALRKSDGTTKAKFMEKWTAYMTKGEIAFAIDLVGGEAAPDDTAERVEKTLGDTSDAPPISVRFASRATMWINKLIVDGDIPEGTVYNGDEMDMVLKAAMALPKFSKYDTLDKFKTFIDDAEDGDVWFRRMVVKYAEPK